MKLSTGHHPDLKSSRKKRILFLSALVVILSATFFSFKSGEKESCNIALVSSVFSKEKAGEGFLIQYGDGSVELKTYEFKRNLGEAVSVMAQIMNEMHAKGYYYAGPGSHAYTALGYQTTYMIFEKK